MSRSSHRLSSSSTTRSSPPARLGDWAGQQPQERQESWGNRVRDYANIITAIWRDARFRALPAAPQRTYLMLVTQPDISGAGTLPLTVRRWAQNAPDTSREDISADLKALEAAGFIYADEDTEELLVRTFVKHDKGYTNPKRKPVILSAAAAIESPKLRRVLWSELEKLGLADSLPQLSETSTDSLSDSQSASDRVVVTVVTTGTSTLDPHSTTQPPAAARARDFGEPPPESEPGQAEQILAEWLSKLRKRPPGKVVNAIGAEVRGALSEGQDPADVREALALWQRKGNLGAGHLASFIHQVANSEPSNVLALPAARASPRESTTDARVADGLALVAQLEAQEARR